MRNFVKILVGFLIFLILIVQIPLFTILTEITNQNNIKDALDKSTLYDEIPTWASSELELKARESFEEAMKQNNNELPFSEPFLNNIYSQVEDITVKYLDKFVTKEIVKTTVDNNLDSIFDFFNKKDKDELLIFIPVTQTLSTIDSQAPGFISDVRKVFENIRTCNSAEVAALENSSAKNLECIPPELRTEFDKKFNEDFANEILTAIDELKKNDTVLSGGDYITYTEFLKLGEESERQKSTEELTNDLNQAKDYYQTAKMILLLSWIPTLLLVLLFYILAKGDAFNKMFNVSVLTSIVGGVLTFIVGVFRFIVITELIKQKDLIDIPEEVPQSVFDAIVKFIETLAKNLTDELFYVSLFMLIFGAGIAVLMKQIEKKQKAVTVKN